MTLLVISELLLVAFGATVIVAAIRFRPRYFVPDRIKQDRARQVVEIDGIELSGWITKGHCEKCKSFLIYYEQYDEDFCPECNAWARPASTDPGLAEFKRPVRPLPEIKT